jgi:hypothetical protein
MNLAIRQLLQKAVAEAAPESDYVKLRCKNGDRLKMRADLVCYETHIEATDEMGAPITLSYSEIEDVSTVQRPLRSTKQPAL